MKKLIGWIIGIGNAFLTPFVAMLMWNWFVTELGAPKVGYGLSFGLIVLLDFVMYKYSDDDADITEVSVIGLLFTLVMWLIAFVVHVSIG